MKLSKALLHAMLVAVTAGTVISCEKPKVVTENKKTAKQTPATKVPESCPACGMG